MSTFRLPRSARRLLLQTAAACLALSLTACGDSAPVPGEIAKVDGKGISFQAVESRRALLFSGRSPETPGIDDALLQEQYRYVLAKMIEEAIILQYMEARNIGLEPGAPEAEEQRIRDDYPGGAFEEMLVERGLGLEQWREALTRRLRIDRFLDRVLRPEISINADEVQQYYREHSDEFVIPEQWHFMQIVGADNKEVDRARDILLDSRDATQAQREALVSIHDISMGAELIPEDIMVDLKPLRPWQASRTRKRDTEYRSLVLVEKIPATMVDAAEVSKRVERALVEEKMRAIYADWIQKRLDKADVRISPLLFQELDSNAQIPGTPTEGHASAEPDSLPEAAR